MHNRSTGYPRSAPTLFFIGRIDEPRKGLHVLMDAHAGILEAFPGTQLLVAGPGRSGGGDRGSCLGAYRDPTVRFLGLVSDADKVRAFASADLYIAPNTGGESFGIVLLEAMATGTPVVASDLEAFARVLEDGRAGAMFISEDSGDLART
jgi:phosphatidylinositol alpha-mannosyltransferase